MDPGRCSIHGLIVAEDGRCVICRRGSGTADEPEKTISDTTWAVLIGGVVLAGIGAYVLYKDPFHPAPAAPVSDGNAQTVATQPVEPPPPPPPPHKPPVFITDQPATTAAALPQVPSEDADAKNAAALEKAKKLVQIKMYAKTGDALSQEVKKYFAKKGYAYVEYDIDKSETDKILMNSLNPSGSVPTFDIDGAVVTDITREELDGAITRAARARLGQAGAR